MRSSGRQPTQSQSQSQSSFDESAAANSNSYPYPQSQSQSQHAASSSRHQHQHQHTTTATATATHTTYPYSYSHSPLHNNNNNTNNTLHMHMHSIHMHTSSSNTTTRRNVSSVLYHDDGGYVSPLTQTLTELRRKHAAAAGPQMGIFGLHGDSSNNTHHNGSGMGHGGGGGGTMGGGGHHGGGDLNHAGFDSHHHYDTSDHQYHPNNNNDHESNMMNSNNNTNSNHDTNSNNNHNNNPNNPNTITNTTTQQPYHHYSSYNTTSIQEAVAAASEEDPFLMEFSLLPLAYAGDVDVEDMARRLGEEENDRSWQHQSSSRYSVYPMKPPITMPMSRMMTTMSTTGGGNGGRGNGIQPHHAQSSNRNVNISGNGSNQHDAHQFAMLMRHRRSLSHLSSKSSNNNNTTMSTPMRSSSSRTMEHDITLSTSSGGVVGLSNSVVTPSSSFLHDKNQRSSRHLHHHHYYNRHQHHHHHHHSNTTLLLTTTSHAQSLLTDTPFLRHLSPASAEMQGESAYTKSHNPFFFLNKTGSALIKSVLQSATNHMSFTTTTASSSSQKLQQHGRRKSTSGSMDMTSSTIIGNDLSSSITNNNNNNNINNTTSSSNNNNNNNNNTTASTTNTISSSLSSDYKTYMTRQRVNQKAAMELAAFVRVLAHEMTMEEFSAVENEIYTIILSFMHSSNTVKRLAGVAALDALMSVSSADEEKKVTKLAKNLSYGLRANHVDYEFLNAVTKALGRMALGASNVDYVECEVTRALEWLKKERSDRRLAAVLTLKELAKNAPAAYYSKTNHQNSGTNEFIDLILPVINDPQPIVRTCAADALSECLKILVVSTRKHHSTIGLLCQIYFHVMDGFELDHPTNGCSCTIHDHNGSGRGGSGSKRFSSRMNPSQQRKNNDTNNNNNSTNDNNNKSSSSNSNNNNNNNVESTTSIIPSNKSIAQIEAAQHGSLLVVSVLLEHTQDFMLPRFDEVCRCTLGLKYHVKALIRLEVVRLIPKLAQRCPGAFGRRYLQSGLEYLLKSASDVPSQRAGGVDVRPAAYIALGQLILAMCSSQRDESGLMPKSTLQILEKSKLKDNDNDDEEYDDDVEDEEKEKEKVEGNSLQEGKESETTSTSTSTPNRRTSSSSRRSYHRSVPYEMKVGDIYANLDQIFTLVRRGLGVTRSTNSNRGTPVNTCTRSAALQCAADIVQGLGSQAQPYIGDLLNDMFDSGLSEDLIYCLRAIAVSLSSENATIEKRLMEELSLSLAGTSAVNDICDPLVRSTRLDGSPSTPMQININMSERPDVVVKLVLSLQTLGSFRDSKSDGSNGGTILPFIKNVVAQYLSHPCANVRREAALTCCLLLVPHENEPVMNADGSDGMEDYSDMSLPPSCLRNSRVGSASSLLIEEVLHKLLCVAVSDSSPLVRHCVVRGFDVRYDPHLCQAHHLPPLFLLLQDEALAVRAAALRLLGRLARLNPAPILPGLRRVLTDLIIELRCSGDVGGGKEAATRLLIVFLRSDALHRLVHPFLHSIIEALPLQNAQPRLLSAGLEALGELARVVGTALQPWVNELFPLILNTMQDQSSSSKQRTSLRTLGLIAAGTGYVVDPYLDYPQLMAQAADVLPATKRAPWSLRREVIRTLGILGAIDPDRYHTSAGINTRKGGGKGSGYFIGMDEEDEISTAKRRPGALNSSVLNKLDANPNLSHSALSKSAFDARATDQNYDTNMQSLNYATANVKRNNDDDDEPAHLHMYEQYAMTAQPASKLPPARRISPSDDEFYPTVALQALTRILKDPALAVHHGMVMQAVMYIFYTLGLRCVPFLKRIVPHILHTARTCGQATLREALLQQVVSLSGIVRDNLRPYVPAIFEVVEEFWSSKHLATILILVERMAVGVPDDFRKYVPGLVPRLLSSIEDFSSGSSLRDNDKFSEEVGRIDLIIRSIRNLRGTLGEYMHLLVPSLLKLTDSLIHSPVININESSQEIFLELTVNSIQTISILLHAKERGGSLGFESNNSTGIAQTTQNSTLPARAAQPLIRMLGKEYGVGKEVGLALVEALCVCAKLLGIANWMPLYHKTTRNTIVAWQHRMNMDLSQDSVDLGSPPENAQPLAGLQLYDEIIKEIVIGSHNNNSYLWRIGTFDRNTRHAGAPGVGTGLESNFNPLDNDLQTTVQPITGQANKHRRVNQALLERAWDVSQRATREDWDEWMRRFAVHLLREAPAPALRATAELAYAYQPLARELFSAAFVCCWAELKDNYRESLVHALKTAFFADASPEILQTLLNLAEFMEHDGVEDGLPLDINILAKLALKCRSYAKALHYKEREHRDGGGGSCIEDLISINKQLDLPEAALGVLKAAQVELERHGVNSWQHPQYNSVHSRIQHGISSKIFHRHQGFGLAYSVMSTADEIAAIGGGAWAGVEMQESWLARLGSWSDALAMYERKLDESPGDVSAILGCMKCLDARGQWKQVLELAKRSWSAFSYSNNTQEDHRGALNFCAKAAWMLGKWDDLGEYSIQLVESTYDPNPIGVPRIDFDGALYSAIVSIHRKDWSLAADYIDAAQRAMDSRFTALLAESHKRAYPSTVTAMTLAEMEEIVTFKKLEDRARAGLHRHRANRDDEVAARKQLLQLWRKRLAGCRVDAEVHSSILAVRSLVLGPTDEVDATITLSSLSRQSQSFKFAERVLLDPLEKLGADLNGAVFGFNLPESLKLGLLQTRDGRSVETYHSDDLHHVVAGKVDHFFPHYGPSHHKYCQYLRDQAGGLEKLNVQHQLYYAYVKHLWAMDQRSEAMERLTHLSNVVDMTAHDGENQGRNLHVSCWLKLGEWKIEESHPPGAPLNELTQKEVLMAFKRATTNNNSGYKAWHNWALINFRLAQQIYESRPSVQNNININAPKVLRNHVVAAVQGFVKAVCHGTKRWSASVQQDLLNFLTCLFRYGDLTEVADIIKTEIDAVTLEAWLGVLPQLLARIHIKSSSIRSVLHQLLIRLGEKHPQALIYPLSVLLKSPVIERMDAAESLMNSLKRHSYSLVEEALMVSSELIRVAILWLEQWHEGLEDASRLYFGEGNVSGMLEVLLPLHEELERGPSTRREQDFHKSFGTDLAEAHTYVKEYVRLTTSNGGEIPTQGGLMQSHQADPSEMSTVRQNAEAEAALNQAWDLYYTVFRRINKQLPALTSLELHHCSPALLKAHNLVLSVPGSYRCDGSYVKIERFIPSVQVITSKQRPRKIILRGGDGKDYGFLLKGHEDLRQDERVMQLFGLVNALLARDRRTNNHDLNIQRYTIAPLAHNAGVVGWVPHCDTFHNLIRDYRESKRIPLSMENREMQKLCPGYDQLTVMQKIEVFSDALDQTKGKGNDLYEVLWIKSTNSEEWLERRTKFTRSLAVMSMVGYILGLGDRHPSNLMLDQISGRVLHIDFGDCFEVAMQREKFPEKIPFRLTRMLTKAMEVSGIEGSYRSTCERTMGVLRDNRDSLIAMLEAFVYDPLISWRLLDDIGSSSEENKVNRSEKSLSMMEEDFQEQEIGGGRSYTASQSLAQSLVQEPIRESANEDDEDIMSERGSGSEPNWIGQEQRKGISIPQNNFDKKSHATGSVQASSQMRSMQMYSDIQSMAANVLSSSRIASITCDGVDQQVADGSLAQSRMSIRRKQAMSIMGGEAGAANNEEALTERALKVIRRVQDKLTGTDFFQADDDQSDPLDVQDQVQRLVVQATSTENLCQCYVGWCAFW